MRLLQLLALPIALVACTTQTKGSSAIVPAGASVVLQERLVRETGAAGSNMTLTCEADACGASDLAGHSVTLAADDGTTYRLGPIIFTGDGVASAEPFQVGGEDWVVDLQLDPDAARELERVTADAVADPSTQSQIGGVQIAVVLNGRVIQAPVIQAPISSGKVQLSGFTQQEAADLANALNA